MDIVDFFACRYRCCWAWRTSISAACTSDREVLHVLFSAFVRSIHVIQPLQVDFCTLEDVTRTIFSSTITHSFNTKYKHCRIQLNSTATRATIFAVALTFIELRHEFRQ